MSAQAVPTIRRYGIGNAPRPQVGASILVPFNSNLHRAVVLDVTRDDVVVRVEDYVRALVRKRASSRRP